MPRLLNLIYIASATSDCQWAIFGCNSRRLAVWHGYGLMQHILMVSFAKTGHGIRHIGSTISTKSMYYLFVINIVSQQMFHDI